MIQMFSLLINSFWEGAVIAVVAWIALRTARDANATTRYLVWTCALVVAVMLPIVTTFVVAAPKGNGVSAASTKALSAATVASNSFTAKAPAHFAQPRAVDVPKNGFSFGGVVVIPQPAVWVVLGVWGLLGLWQLVRFIFALFALERLKRNATPLPIAYRQHLCRWNAAEPVRSNVRLCVSDEITVPIAVGLFDAMILVPKNLLERMPHEDVDRILLHELTHLRRGDDWVQAFQRFVTALCFFNPAIGFIARQMDLEREVSCDDSVLERDGLQPLPYATCLTKMAEIVAWPYQPLAAPGVFDTRRSLSIRVERLLNSARNNRTRIAAAPALTALLVMSAAGIAGAAVSSRFSFELPGICPNVTRLPAHIRAFTHVRIHAPIHTAVRTRETVAAVPVVVAQPLVRTEPVIRTKPAARVAVRAKPKTNKMSVVPVGRASAPKVVLANATADPGNDYIQELANEGYRGLSINELVEMRSVGVDRDYIRAIEAAGYPHPSPRELVELRSTDVTPQVISEMRRRFGSVTLRDLVELHSVGVTGDYIDSLARAGFQNLRARDVVELRAVGVTPDVISALRSRLPSVTLRQLVEMQSVGVDTEYIDSLARAGYSGLNAEQLTDLRSLGVDEEYIKKVRARGFNNVTVHQLIQMKATGLL